MEYNTILAYAWKEPTRNLSRDSNPGTSEYESGANRLTAAFDTFADDASGSTCCFILFIL
jgi:hypothetical protein